VTGRERVQAAITGDIADRRAVSLTLSLYGARLTGCPLQTYYADPAAYADGQRAVRETFDPDILFGPFALPMEGAAFGSEISYYDNQAPNLARPVLADIDALDRLIVPDVETHPGLIYFREAVRRMATEHGPEVPVAAVALSPVDLPIMLMGIEGWLATVLFQEDGTRRMLGRTVPFFVRRVNDLFAAGATFVLMPSAFINPRIVPRGVIERLALPAPRRAFAQVAGPLLMHSGGARLAPFLDLFVGLPNVVGFVVNSREDISLAREKAGPGPLLVGNIDGPGLHRENPHDIQAGAERLLRRHADDPHFILGTSAADIAYETPLSHIRAVGSAARSASAVGRS